MAIYKRLVIFIIVACTSLIGAEKKSAPMCSAIWLTQAPPSVELYTNGPAGQPQPIEVGLGHRGAPFSVAASGSPVILSIKVIDAPVKPGGKPVERYVPVGEIKWPEVSTKTALLILTWVNPEGAPLQIVGKSLADDIVNFKRHSIRAVNFTGDAVMGRFKGAVSTIPAASDMIFNYPVAPIMDGSRLATFPARFAGKAGILFDGGIDAWPQSRTLFIIHLDETAGRSGAPVARLLIDVPPITAEETVASQSVSAAR